MSKQKKITLTLPGDEESPGKEIVFHEISTQGILRYIRNQVTKPGNNIDAEGLSANDLIRGCRQIKFRGKTLGIRLILHPAMVGPMMRIGNPVDNLGRPYYKRRKRKCFIDERDIHQCVPKPATLIEAAKNVVAQYIVPEEALFECSFAELRSHTNEPSYLRALNTIYEFMRDRMVPTIHNERGRDVCSVVIRWEDVLWRIGKSDKFFFYGFRKVHESKEWRAFITQYYSSGIFDNRGWCINAVVYIPKNMRYHKDPKKTEALGSDTIQRMDKTLAFRCAGYLENYEIPKLGDQLLKGYTGGEYSLPLWDWSSVRNIYWRDFQEYWPGRSFSWW